MKSSWGKRPLPFLYYDLEEERVSRRRQLKLIVHCCAHLSCWDIPVYHKETTEKVNSYSWYVLLIYQPDTTFKSSHHRCLMKVLKTAELQWHHAGAWWMLAQGKTWLWPVVKILCLMGLVESWIWVVSWHWPKSILCHRESWEIMGLGRKLALAWGRCFCLKEAWEMLGPEHQMALIWVRLPWANRHGKYWIQSVS